MGCQPKGGHRPIVRPIFPENCLQSLLVFRKKDLCEAKHDVGVEKICGGKCLKMVHLTLSPIFILGGGVKRTKGKVDHTLPSVCLTL